MMHFTQILTFSIGVLSCALAAIAIARVNHANIVSYEKFFRARYGVVIGAIGLIWCVPHAIVIVPASMEWLLYPAAAVVAVLSYFYLDFVMSRSIAGAMIILGYETVHGVFDLQLPLSQISVVLAWAIGIIGIYCAAFPYAMRDALRTAASHRWFKLLLFAFSALVLLNMIMNVALVIAL